MRRSSKRVIGFLSAFVLVLLLISSFSFFSWAKEGEDQTESFKEYYKVGDIIKFGHYEQDGNEENGKEEIEWQVIKVESNRVLVISKYLLDRIPYNTEQADVTWESCSLRHWLNNDFLNSAFTQEEQNKIPTVNIENKNLSSEAANGNNTDDQVFCLSMDEIESYFGRYSCSGYNYNQNLIGAPTKYAISQGASAYSIEENEFYNNLRQMGYTSDVIGQQGGWWWLRSPGTNGYAGSVEPTGYVSSDSVDWIWVAVRPVIYINQSTVNPENIHLNKTVANMTCDEEMTLTASIMPAEMAETEVIWMSSNPKVATVENGVVKAVSEGSAVITAKTVNELIATCDVNVITDSDKYNVGDLIKFGHYEQDGNEANGKEDIVWQVLKVESDRMLVISKYALDCKPYIESMMYSDTLTTWLNEEFIDAAFTSAEQELIPVTHIENKNNPLDNSYELQDSEKQMFCLSLEEMERYFGDYDYYDSEIMWGFNQNLICTPTQYAINNGAYYYDVTENKYNSYFKGIGYTKDVIGRRGTHWWLRTPGYHYDYACYVGGTGTGGANNNFVKTSGNVAVRPALYISLKVYPEKVELNTTTVGLACGEEMTLTATLTPDNVTEKTITWTSSKPEVATVEDGVVKAVSVGTTIITATTENELTATCVISVINDSEPYKVGDFIKFGHYEQDGNVENGKEDIVWKVLKIESGRALVVSEYVLDKQPYNTENTDVTWESSYLRKWLNDDFKNEAFNAEEQELIPTVTVENQGKNLFSIPAGNDTEDQIFCLSRNEFKTYFSNSYWTSVPTWGVHDSVICTPTKYADEKGLACTDITEESFEKDYSGFGYTKDIIGRRGTYWWLRSPGSSSSMACMGSATGGDGLSFGSVIGSGVGVRPAIYINLSVINPETISLNKTAETLTVGKELTLTATLTPDEVTEKTITWTSSKPDVASVEDGVVKALSEGKTTITAKTVNDLTATCEITVVSDESLDIFADIKVDTWQYKAAKAVYEKGYMTGTGKAGEKIIFSPNTDMNRTMFVQALYSMDGKPEVTYVQKFSDVKENAWYAKAVTWASNNGIVAGNPDGTFGINGKATREQMALMLYKYAVYKKYDVSVKDSTTLDNFTDANKVDSWALTAVKWAVERGIISGKGNAQTGYRIAPTEKATRIECAAMLNKFDEFYAGALTYVIEDIEEPLALPEEGIEDGPVPEEDTEDIIDKEEDDSEEEDIIEDDDENPAPEEDVTDDDNSDTDAETDEEIGFLI